MSTSSIQQAEPVSRCELLLHPCVFIKRVACAISACVSTCFSHIAHFGSRLRFCCWNQQRIAALDLAGHLTRYQKNMAEHVVGAWRSFMRQGEPQTRIFMQIVIIGQGDQAVTTIRDTRDREDPWFDGLSLQDVRKVFDAGIASIHKERKLEPHLKQSAQKNSVRVYTILASGYPYSTRRGHPPTMAPSYAIISDYYDDSGEKCSLCIRSTHASPGSLWKALMRSAPPGSQERWIQACEACCRLFKNHRLLASERDAYHRALA